MLKVNHIKIPYAHTIITLISTFIFVIVLNLREQVFIAALHLNKLDIANECLNKLLYRFPNSNRVKRLNAMKYEAYGRYNDAIKMYTQLIADNPADLVSMKRKVAVYRAQNQTNEAITELYSILRLFPGDLTACLELADIHKSLKDYEVCEEYKYKRTVYSL